MGELIWYYSELETPDATIFQTDPYRGKGIKDKGAATINGVELRGGAHVLCSDGVIGKLPDDLRMYAREYVRFVGEPASNPFKDVPGIQAIGLSTRNFRRPVFELDRETLDGQPYLVRIEWDGEQWSEVEAESTT